jgi:hypothetical protein
MNIEPINLKQISEAFEALSDVICDTWDGSDEPSPILVSKAMLQLFEVLDENDSSNPVAADKPLKSDEIDELGDYGLTLLQEMSAFAADLGLKDISEQVEDLTFPFSIWMARHNTEIKNIAPVVNAVARQANVIQEPHQLKQLYYYINEILDNLSPAISQDLEKTNPMRPWRILIINRAIIATRCYDTDFMNKAFETLIDSLPEDAARFFQEGVEQMHQIDYPEHVKELMQHYFLLHGTSHTLH